MLEFTLSDGRIFQIAEPTDSITLIQPSIFMNNSEPFTFRAGHNPIPKEFHKTILAKDTEEAIIDLTKQVLKKKGKVRIVNF